MADTDIPSSAGEVRRIQDQLQRAYEGAAWHGPALQEVLNGVSASAAAARPLPHAHSIWEIALLKKASMA